LPLEEKILLNDICFDTKAKDLWVTIFDSVSESIINTTDLNKKDYEYWNSNKFDFSSLFSLNYVETDYYEKIKKSFESWYWGVGIRMCNKFSGSIIEKYYFDLIDMGKAKNLPLKDIVFHLQVVYDNPPKEWKLKNENMIIISPQAMLPTVEEIFNLLLR